MNNVDYMSMGSTSARSAMQDYIITTSDKLKNTDEYKTVVNLIYRLMESGVTYAAKGYCISMSDIVYTILKQNNIPCRIVECQLTVTNNASKQLYVVGFKGLKDSQDRADTHVVVVTETEVPMLIDVSISHLLPNNLQGVIDEVQDGSDILANIHSIHSNLTYQQKTTFSIPLLHQMSIVDRIKTDTTLMKTMSRLKVFLYVLLLVSSFNALRGLVDFYLVYGAKNYWGPETTREIYNNIQIINDKLDNLIQPSK